MPMDLPTLLRPGLRVLQERSVAQPFAALVVGAERQLTLQARSLLEDAGLPQAQLIELPSLNQAVERLGSERPGIVFFGVGLPELANLNALVRLQAAAPGVPIVPLPTVTPETELLAPWWPFRARRAIDRGEVVNLLQQLALLDQGARHLFYLATHDRLTGLANRWLLEERLAHALARCQRQRTAGALLFLDLDGFKAINDRHGHAIGDRMLVVAAERLIHAVRASDTVARWGGDEFAVILEGIGCREVAVDRGHELVERLAEPVALAGFSGPLRASIGVALFPEDGEDAGTLLRHADRRMYRAKGRRLLWSMFRRGCATVVGRAGRRRSPARA